MINFISVEGTDYGVSEFTQGSGGKFVTREEMYANTILPMCWAGFFKPQWLEICKKHSLKFYNLDSGYFGNKKKKTIFRLSVNNFQNVNPIIDRPTDRWKQLGLDQYSFEQGSSIVIVPPDRKIIHALSLGSEDRWINDIVLKIKSFTDRPIKVRKRPEPRTDRIVSNNFKNFIKDDTFCVVGYSSNALVEAAMHDIPVISLGHSATKSLYKYQLNDIENIKPAAQELKQAWLNHLAYSQFTRDELLSGKAWKLLTSEPSSIRSGA
jgi:hypothetical protein